MRNISFKVCIFGDGGVGKTTLINRYVTGIFKGDTSITIGVDFHVKKLMINDIPVTLQIWDFAGEERFRFLLPSYVKGALGGIFMFDMTRFPSLKNIREWAEVIDKCTDENARPLPIILVGGKSDLAQKRAIPVDYAEDLLKQYNFHKYIECSSKNGANVEAIFIALAREMMARKGFV